MTTQHRPAPPLRRTFTTRSGPPLISILELQSRCYAAARLSMMGANFSPDDRFDAASRILADVWATIVESGAPLLTMTQRVPTSLQGDGVTYSAKSRQKSKDDAPDVWADIPAIRKSDAPTFSTLAGRAANLRRSLERDRARDAVDAAERAATEAFLPYVPDADPVVRSTPAAAHELAQEMGRAMALDARRPVYVATYTAARSASGEGSDVVAAELEMAPSAYRKALQRGREAISAAYAAPHEMADALYLPDGGYALKPSASRMRTHAIGERDAGWRDSQRAYGIRPVAIGEAPLPAGALPVAPPEWARDLKGTTAARLRHAARRSSEMALGKSDAERAHARLTAGLPA